MLEQVLELLTIGRYVVIGVGILGAVILLVALYRGDRQGMVRGGYMLILSLVVWVCSHLLFTVAQKRMDQRIYQYQQEYEYNN